MNRPRAAAPVRTGRPGPMSQVPRSRTGSFIGTAVALLVTAAVLLAAPELWDLQAHGVGRILDAAGVANEVTGRPAIRVEPPAPVEPRPLSTAAAIAALIALGAAMAGARRIPPALKAGVMLAGAVSVATMTYLTWVLRGPALNVAEVPIDWTTSATGPVMIVALLYAYDISPVPGSVILKLAMFPVAVAAAAVFSMVRLSAVISGYAAFGPSSFLALHQVAGVFWDLAAGVAVIALTHAVLPLTARDPWPLRALRRLR